MKGSHNDPSHPFDARPEDVIEEGDTCDSGKRNDEGVFISCPREAQHVTMRGSHKLCRTCYREYIHAFDLITEVLEEIVDGD